MEGGELEGWAATPVSVVQVWAPVQEGLDDVEVALQAAPAQRSQPFLVRYVQGCRCSIKY